MMELYDTAYPPKLPIVDGLLYNGTYLFVGSPKIRKFFHGTDQVSLARRKPLWGFPVRQGTVLYLALEDDYASCRNGYHRCSEWKGNSENFYFATKNPNRSMTDWKGSL